MKNQSQINVFMFAMGEWSIRMACFLVNGHLQSLKLLIEMDAYIVVLI